MIIDGTQMGKCWFTVLAMLGERGCYTFSMEHMENRGQERACAIQLIEELKPEDMPDLIMGDGLYLFKGLLDLVCPHSSHN